VKYDESGIPLAPLRVGDSASVAGQDYDEGMPRQDIVPGDSRSAMGQTLASGMNNGGGAATTVGPNGSGGLFDRPDNRGEQSMHNDAPNDGSRVGTNPRAVLEWQAEAGALRGSCEKLDFLLGKERQDWLSDAEEKRRDLATRFHAMDTVGQGKCMPLMRLINTLLDRQGVEQVGDGRPVEASQEPSGMNDPLKKGNAEEGAPEQIRDSPTGPEDSRDDQQNDRNERSTPHPGKRPLSPSGQSTTPSDRQSPEHNNDPNPPRKRGRWPNH
jgi:hypothetical protein